MSPAFGTHRSLPAFDALPNYNSPLTLSSTTKVAIVHDWLAGFGGAERCLIALHQLFPTAPIYTLVHDAKQTPPELADANIVTSHLQRLPGATTDYQRFLPPLP